jgi:redox-sensitive bicupin YhaK (pirin superfamily)
MSIITQSIAGRTRDVGGFSVARILPSPQRRHLGPFIFLDEMGPATFAPGQGIDVRPHPHIGLATVTYLFEGAMQHRDSLGTVIDIMPGACNWMAAGRGICHSERTPPGPRADGHRIHGLQAWVALPLAEAEDEPWFQHVPSSEVPEVTGEGVYLRLLAGSWDGAVSTARFSAATLYAHVELEAGARLPLGERAEEIGVYLLHGAGDVCGEMVGPGAVHVLAQDRDMTFTAHAATRLMVLGGTPHPEPVFLDWNFAAYSKERLAQAREDWRASARGGWAGTHFSLPPGEYEHIPYPGDPD